MVRGSPPHAWGRLPVRCFHSSQNRFTPTRVGTTQAGRSVEKREAVHPHTRGDDSVTLASSTAASGSPPHAWGRRGDGFLIEAGVRFTPTRVGTTGLRHIPPQHGAVHPHTRGDDDRCQIPSFRGSGSPPHAWGRQLPADCPRRWGRFTPTRVGTTVRNWLLSRELSVHPHTRGDDGKGLG